jgi:hypothetical protein
MSTYSERDIIFTSQKQALCKHRSRLGGLTGSLSRLLHPLDWTYIGKNQNPGLDISPESGS